MPIFIMMIPVNRIPYHGCITKYPTTEISANLGTQFVPT